jgi:sarcosine oxidase
MLRSILKEYAYSGKAADMVNTKNYDVIVVGAGVMGAATMFELATRGRKVLGFEQFYVGHDRGSSHGQNRIIRRAYYEHPSYVPLVNRAFEKWYELEQIDGHPLLIDCDCLSVGSHDSEMIRGVQHSARTHLLDVVSLSGDDLRNRFPQFRFNEEMVGLLERRAGFLLVDACLSALVRTSLFRKARINQKETIESWVSDGKMVTVTTNKSTYHAEKLVLTAGSWAPSLLANEGTRFRVMRQVMFWVQPDERRQYRRDIFPVFLVDTPNGAFYGLPAINSSGIKVAQHYGAEEVRHPDEVDRTIHDEDFSPVKEFLSKHLPGVNGKRTRGEICMYTMSPDKHFVLDVHPAFQNVFVATGFSGHGFKFAPVVGEIMADLVEKGHTNLPAEMFRLSRFN